MTPRALRLMAIAVMALLPAPSGCSAEPSPWVRPRRQAATPIHAAELVPALRVEYGGCTTVQLESGGELECVYRPGETLRLWVTHEPGVKPQFRMEGDGAWSMGEPYVLPEELGQGYRLALEEPGLEAVTVELPHRPAWRLALRAVGELPKERRELINALTRRFVELEAWLVKPDLDVLPQVQKILREMIEHGQLWLAIKSGAAAAYHLTWRAGRPELAQEILENLRRSLEQPLASLNEQYPFGMGVLSIYMGHALRRRGQLTEAAREYRDGARSARRVGNLQYELDALSPYALVLAELGYFEAAAYWSAEARDLAAEHASPYNLAETLAMVAKVSLKLRKAHQIYDDPVLRLDEIKRIYGPGGPLDGHKEPFDAVLSRAELQLQSGDFAETLADLDELSRKKLPNDYRVRVNELRLRTLIQQEVPSEQIQRTLSELKKQSNKAVGTEIRWKIETLAGRAAEASRNFEEAVTSYERAEAILDGLIPLAAIGIPGDLAAARLNESSARLTAVLIATGDIEKAMCTIRRARSRLGRLITLRRNIDKESQSMLETPIQNYQIALAEYEEALKNASGLAKPALRRARSLATQRRQQLEQQAFHILSSQGNLRQSPVQCSDFSASNTGELLVLLYSDDRDLHVFHKFQNHAARHFALNGYFESIETSDDWKSDLLLHPLHKEISQASIIRILSSGKSHMIPFHALPWTRDSREHRKRPLVQSIPVVYGLDILSNAAPLDRRKTRALILSDPRANGSEREAREVIKSMKKWGWSANHLSTETDHPDTIRTQLQESDHFHYAGHAHYDDKQTQRNNSGVHATRSHRRWPPYSGGAASTPSHIPLSEHSKITPVDILLLPHAPRTAVLMGCKTSILDERISYGGYSLTSAFLGAGTQVVIASTHDIDGDQTAILGSSLYNSITPTQDVDTRHWITNALNHIERSGQTTSEVKYYRTYVP